MNVDALFGLEPTGTPVQILCAVVALAVGVLIVGGFASLWQSERQTHGLAGTAKQSLPELGLVALWRLERAVRGDRSLPAGSQIQPSRTDPTISAVPSYRSIGDNQ